MTPNSPVLLLAKRIARDHGVEHTVVDAVHRVGKRPAAALLLALVLGCGSGEDRMVRGAMAAAQQRWGDSVRFRNLRLHRGLSGPVLCGEYNPKKATASGGYWGYRPFIYYGGSLLTPSNMTMPEHWEEAWSGLCRD